MKMIMFVELKLPSMTDATKTVPLSTDLIYRVEQRVERTDFDSTEEYISYVLEEVLYHVEEVNDLSDVSDADEDEVRGRLKSLGYLDE